MIRFFSVLLIAMVFLGGTVTEAQAKDGAPVKAKKAKRCVFPQSRKRAPVWVCDKHAPGLAFTALGSAARSRAGISFMEQMALADARTHLVQEVRASVQSKFADEAHADKATAERNGALITRITNDALQGTRIEKRASGPHGSLYVLTGLSEANANRLIESVTAEYRLQRQK